MSKLNLRSATVAAFGILIAIGGCAESPTGPSEPAVVRAVTPAEASAKPATPANRPNFAGYSTTGS